MKKIIKIQIILSIIILFNGCNYQSNETLNTEPPKIEKEEQIISAFTKDFTHKIIFPYETNSEELVDKEQDEIISELKENFDKFDPINLINNNPKKFKANFDHQISDSDIQDIKNLLEILETNKQNPEYFSFSKTYHEDLELKNEALGPIKYLIEDFTNVTGLSPEPTKNSQNFHEDKYISETGIDYETKFGKISVIFEDFLIKYILTDLSHSNSGPGGTYEYGIDIIIEFDDELISKMLVKNNQEFAVKDTPLFEYYKFKLSEAKIRQINLFMCNLEVNQLAIPRISYITQKIN